MGNVTSRNSHGLLCMFSLVLIFIYSGLACGQMSTAKIVPEYTYQNYANVPGGFPSGQAVCEARKNAINWIHLTYVIDTQSPMSSTAIPEIGHCEDVQGRVMAGPRLEGQCPFGWTMQGANGEPAIDDPEIGAEAYWGVPGYQHAPNAICVRTGIDLGKNAGGSNQCPSPMQGNPINTGVGNKYQSEVDFTAPNGLLIFKRSYNSTGDEDAAQQFGYTALVGDTIGRRWRSNYAKRLQRADSATISSVVAIREDGKSLYFFKTPESSQWTSEADTSNVLKEIIDSNGLSIGWQLINHEQEIIETYDQNGFPTSDTTLTGLTRSYSYSNALTPVEIAPTANLLISVTDSFGRSLSFFYDQYARISKLRDTNNNEYLFQYADFSLLSGVIYPGGDSKTYLYSERSNMGGLATVDALTGIVDENGVRYATFQYQNSGRAVGTVHANGADSVTLNYTAPYVQTVVTDALGAARTFGFSNILGVNRLTGVSQPGGSGCGAASSAITYDVNGNAASRTDFNGNKQCAAFDLSRNLETVRLEGLPAATSCPADLNAYSIPAPAVGQSIMQTKTSTQWHPNWRLESRRAEPKLITTSVYNGQVDPTNVGAGPLLCAPASATIIDATGTSIPITVLCRKIEQATSDETGTLGFGATAVGAPRIWNYTYNQYGQMLSEDGPRTDVNDITSYAYYADTSFDAAGAGHTLGDLQQVTNALSQTTTYLSYDKAGHLLQSQNANGVVTQSTYTPRGWLKSQSTVSGTQTLTTTYDYDGVGQLLKVTQPDGSFTTYTYDAAHRLTDIGDSLNNTIHYTLDAAGNRTSEQVKDPLGTLKRTTTRIFDQLGRLQNVVVQ